MVETCGYRGHIWGFFDVSVRVLAYELDSGHGIPCDCMAGTWAGPVGFEVDFYFCGDCVQSDCSDLFEKWYLADCRFCCCTPVCVFFFPNSYGKEVEIKIHHNKNRPRGRFLFAIFNVRPLKKELFRNFCVLLKLLSNNKKNWSFEIFSLVEKWNERNSFLGFERK